MLRDHPRRSAPVLTDERLARPSVLANHVSQGLHPRQSLVGWLEILGQPFFMRNVEEKFASVRLVALRRLKHCSRKFLIFGIECKEAFAEFIVHTAHVGASHMPTLLRVSEPKPLGNA